MSSESALRERLTRNLVSGACTTFAESLDLTIPAPPEHQVPAHLVIEMLTGDAPAPPPIAALRLRGVEIVDDLILEYAVLQVPLILDRCRIGAINLEQAEAIDMWFIDCHIDSIEGSQFQSRHNLALPGTRVVNGLVLIGAQIGGQLDLSGAHLSNLSNPDGPALDGDALRVDVLVTCGPSSEDSNVGRRSFRCEGEFALTSATLTGDLYLGGAQLSNQGGVAFNGGGLTVNGSMTCAECVLSDGWRSSFTALGEVRLLAGSVEGDVDFTGAQLTNPDGPALNAERLAVGKGIWCRSFSTHTPDQRFRASGEVSLLEARVERRIDLTGAVFKDRLDLRGARVGRFEDKGTQWPDAVALDGFTYDALPGLARQGSVPARLEWLGRGQPDGYRPRVYNQLATTYRNGGLDDAARDVLLAKQRARARARSEALRRGLYGAVDLPAWHQREVQLRDRARARGISIWDLFLTYSIGYGYRPGRILAWLVGALVLASVAFTFLHPTYVEPAPAFAKDPGSSEIEPTFSPFLFSLDLLLPVATLGQRTAFVTEGPATWVAATFTVSGWLFGAVLVAGLGGVFKRD